jgi:hypothetical protein
LRRQRHIVAKVNCDAGDDFASIWQKAFKDIVHTEVQPAIGFTGNPSMTFTNLAERLPLIVQPDDVRRLLTDVSSVFPTLIVLDEFDRLTDKVVPTLISDTIKGLSDFGVGASILLIGVASSVDELIVAHQSIERALVQIHMPRLPEEEIKEIFSKGMARLEMQMDGSAISHLTDLSQGLPYIAHLLALNSTRAALDQRTLTITRTHVDTGIVWSLEQWQESVKSAYYEAVKSAQPGNIYKEVLLACALAEVDDRGYFTAASVRTPLSKITGRSLDIPNFARHLKEFSDVRRGGIITRTGTLRRFRFRFVSPLMRPYIIMRGYKEKMI